MKQQLQALLAKVDALSQRERIFLFMSVFVCLVALADFLWFTPASTAHKLLVQRFATQNAELDRLRDELRQSGKPSEPGRQAREELEASKLRLKELNDSILSLAPQDQKGPALELVLQRLLRRQDGLTLLSLDTLKPEAPASGATGTTTSMPAGMSKRGLEFRVKGPYAGLVRYVQALEAALPGLRWGAMELKADRSASELTLRVYAVGVQL